METLERSAEDESPAPPDVVFRDRRIADAVLGAGTDAVNRIRAEHAAVEPPSQGWWRRMLGG